MDLQFSHLTRQMDIIGLDKITREIHVVGAGSIGSLVSLNLAKMGFLNQTVYDFDEVSVENMSCQFYRHKDIGKTKVLALQELIHDFTDQSISVEAAKWPLDDRAIKGIVVIAVDCMDARKAIFERLQQCPMIDYMLDARMGMEDAALYVVNPHNSKDQASYKNTLYSNENAVQERCTAKATIYTAGMLAGLVCKAIKNIVNEEPYPRSSLWSIANNQIQSWAKE